MVENLAISEKLAISAAEGARLLSVSRPIFVRWAKHNNIHPIPIGPRGRRYSMAAIRRALEGQRVRYRAFTNDGTDGTVSPPKATAAAAAAAEPVLVCMADVKPARRASPR